MQSIQSLIWWLHFSKDWLFPLDEALSCRQNFCHHLCWVLLSLVFSCALHTVSMGALLKKLAGHWFLHSDKRGCKTIGQDMGRSWLESLRHTFTQPQLQTGLKPSVKQAEMVTELLEEHGGIWCRNLLKHFLCIHCWLLFLNQSYDHNTILMCGQGSN